VNAAPEQDELYRITYDGSVTDEPGVLAMGGQSDSISGGLRERHRLDLSLTDALRLAVDALQSIGGEGGQPRTLSADQLEVAVLDRNRTGRTFRRITGTALTSLLQAPAAASAEASGENATSGDSAPSEPASGS
jgi:proteasome alpha subunit